MAQIPWGDPRRYKPPKTIKPAPDLRAWHALPAVERKSKIQAILDGINYYEELDDPKKLPDKLNCKEQDEYVKKVLRFCETETSKEKKRRGIEKAFAYAREKRFALNDLYFQFLNEVKNVNTN